MAAGRAPEPVVRPRD
uniref:Uncharacterized protein n=1 Tax=Arundo donax TaxID=35708 RepID=A0A0A9C539_ARUDO